MTPTSNKFVLDWIKDMADMTQPDEIIWIDGSEEQAEALRAEACSTGEMIKLNQEKLPGCYLHRTAINDVARVENRTFICTSKKEDAGNINNWMDPKECYDRLSKLYKGSMKGRKMYVIPYSMSVVGSPFAKYGIELTDSIYVVLNMLIMTRVGNNVLEALGDSADFIKGNRQRILGMDALDHVDDPGGHLGRYCHGLALGNGIIELLIQIGGADIEGGAVEGALLSVLDQRFGAVNGIVGGILQEGLLNRTLGVLAVDDVGHLIGLGRALEGAAGALQLQIVTAVGICGVDLDVADGLAGAAEDDLAVVIAVAAGQRGGQLAVLQANVLVKIHQAQSDANGMGAGVIQAAGAFLLQGLPVPAAGQVAVAQADLQDGAQLAGLCQFLGKHIERSKECLLKDGQHNALLPGKVDQLVALVAGLAKGLFHQNVEAMKQQVLSDGIVHFGIGRIDHQVDILQAQQFMIISQDGAIRILLLGDAAADLVSIYDIFDMIVLVSLTEVVAAVNALAAAALADDGQVEFFHVASS